MINSQQYESGKIYVQAIVENWDSPGVDRVMMDYHLATCKIVEKESPFTLRSIKNMTELKHLIWQIADKNDPEVHRYVCSFYFHRKDESKNYSLCSYDDPEFFRGLLETLNGQNIKYVLDSILNTDTFTSF